MLLLLLLLLLLFLLLQQLYGLWQLLVPHSKLCFGWSCCGTAVAVVAPVVAVAAVAAAAAAAACCFRRAGAKLQVVLCG